MCVPGFGRVLRRRGTGGGSDKIGPGRYPAELGLGLLDTGVGFRESGCAFIRHVFKVGGTGEGGVDGAGRFYRGYPPAFGFS